MELILGVQKLADIVFIRTEQRRWIVKIIRLGILPAQNVSGLRCCEWFKPVCRWPVGHCLIRVFEPLNPDIRLFIAKVQTRGAADFRQVARYSSSSFSSLARL